MSLPTFPGIFAVSHDPAPTGLKAAGATIGTLASLAQIVDQSPLIQTIVVGLVNTVGAVLIGALIKHVSGHGRAKREERAKHAKAKIESLISQHDADVRTITELQNQLDKAKAGNEWIRGDQR